MPVLPSSITAPLWEQFHALIPRRQVAHPLGCHRPRVPDRVVFDKLLARLVLGGTYQQHADHQVSATTLRSRRDEWIAAGVFEALHQAALEAYDQAIGLDLDNLAVDGCIVKAPGGGENTGPSPVDRGKSGTKRSLLVEGGGLPIGCALAGANRHDSPLLRPTLETLGRFGFHLPDRITVHLDSGYDSRVSRNLLTELGCGWRITPKGAFLPINHTRRWVVERTNSWHTRGFKSLAIVTDRRAVVQAAWVALAGAVIVIRRLIRKAWTAYRWDTRTARRP
ncbi:IS5 family transposase [Streptomyces cellulosae]|uniref:Transposase n=1 Tax=Streptomyces thermodiastaticus TaxID=44061 RepID=A0ABU0KKI4_9ACTN|nr:transposase [Streptomyces thermodiastaticus]THC56432.1 IS5 family transposase [Streptomyces sp. Akac8]UVT10324.1 IS5 family transposase [Streptomyces thermocarboxydus]WSB42026.1 IS5 family transposase [Streptomyces cellulosae]WTF21029.1 IS5 family transposase [Streptomyces cellulosae]